MTYWRWWITPRFSPLGVVGLTIGAQILGAVLAWIGRVAGLSVSMTLSWP